MDKFDALSQQPTSYQDDGTADGSVDQLDENYVKPRPYHHGTHYSTAGIVLHYMVCRMVY